MSRIGKKPVGLPSGVTATVSGQTVEIKGPKGVRTFKATDDVSIALEDSAVSITPRGSSKRARQQWGMSRTQIANCVTGVTDGFKKELEINGVGYRASMQGAVLCLNPSKPASTSPDRSLHLRRRDLLFQPRWPSRLCPNRRDRALGLHP